MDPFPLNQKKINEKIYRTEEKYENLLPFYFADIRDSNVGDKIQGCIDEGFNFRGIKVHQTVLRLILGCLIILELLKLQKNKGL